MASISKRSVKIEHNINDFDNKTECVEDAFLDAMELILDGNAEPEDLFFTVRFDVNGDLIASTVTASEKKRND